MNDTKLYRILRPIIKIFTNIVFRPTYIGLENINQDKSFLLAGNHTSNLDCLILMSSTKRSIHFLAKIELWQGFKKIIFQNMGLIPVNRQTKNPKSIQLAEKYLNKNCIVGIFPEGTTEKNRGLLPFKIGAVKMAYDTKCDIVPFTIIGQYKIFRKSITIVFDKPYQIKNEDLEVENEILRNKIKLMGEKYGKNK